MITIALFLLSIAASEPPAAAAESEQAAPARNYAARPVAQRFAQEHEVPASGSGVAVVYYSPDEVPTIYTKIRYATAIVFPEPERIVEVVCGDKDWWQIAGPDRIAYIKPSRAGIATNLTIIGASGNIYQFLLQEITRTPGSPPPPVETPHVKVTMRLGNAFTQSMQDSGPKYVDRNEMDAALKAAEQRLQAATEETQSVKQAAASLVSQEVTRLRATYPASLDFAYQIALHTRPFLVRAMFSDDKFTYIKLDAAEAPAIYEIKDGKPNLVNYDFVDGVFVVRKVVDQGYLAVGKEKLSFSRFSK